MELLLSRQAEAMALSAGLGAAIGIWYDLLRVLRRSVQGWLFTALCDLTFWAVCTAAVFLFSMTVTDGVIRLYALFGCAAGATLWFLTFSPLFCRLLAGLIALFLTPFRLLGRGLRRSLRIFHKFFEKFSKTSSQNAKKSV